MNCHVYVLGSKSEGIDRTYVGWTPDLVRHLEHHKTGTGATSTRARALLFMPNDTMGERRPCAANGISSVTGRFGNCCGAIE
jgi:predicted GIY-YIG superfamily endonuclease